MPSLSFRKTAHSSRTYSRQLLSNSRLASSFGRAHRVRALEGFESVDPSLRPLSFAQQEQNALEAIQQSMANVEIPILVEDYQQIASLVAKDLGWYLIYEVVMTVKERLKLNSVTMDFSESKNELYHFAIKVYLGRAISRHLFHNRPVDLAEGIGQQALEYFALQMPIAPTYKLASYLNYLESWAGEHTDWSDCAPQAFDDLEIEVSSD